MLQVFIFRPAALAIALTAYATDDDRARSLAAGFQVHIAKPIEPEALVKSIASAVGRKVNA